MPGPLNAGYPSGPLTDARGEVQPAWRSFFLALLNRTGGPVGLSSDTTALAASVATIATAEGVNAAAIAAETAAREIGSIGAGAGLAAETAARIAGDTALGTALTAETTARIAADATLTSGLAAEIARAEAAEAAIRPLLPLCNGDLPGPGIMADPLGQCIGVAV